MADKLLSEVRYGSEDYKIYDADAARSTHSHDWTSITDKPSTFTPATHSHSNYLPLTGGTVTGTGITTDAASVRIKDDTIDRDGTAPTSDYWSAKALMFKDKNNEDIGYVKPVWKTNGAIATVIGANSEKSDGSTASNALKVIVDRSGNCSYEVSSPAAFRTAIGVTNASLSHMGEEVKCDKLYASDSATSTSSSLTVANKNGVIYKGSIAIPSGYQYGGIYGYRIGRGDGTVATRVHAVTNGTNVDVAIALLNLSGGNVTYTNSANQPSVYVILQRVTY